MKRIFLAALLILVPKAIHAECRSLDFANDRFTERLSPEILSRYNEIRLKVASVFGKLVQTSNGVGVLIAVDVPSNGLYYMPEHSKVTVWFGPGPDGVFISRQYAIEEVESYGGRNRKYSPFLKDLKKFEWLSSKFLTTQMTPNGRGTILSIKFPHNGLFVETWTADIKVWFGVHDRNNSWVQILYKPTDIER